MGIKKEYENSVIEIEEVSYDIDEIEKQGYEKLPQSVFEKLSMGLHYLPGNISGVVVKSMANKNIRDISSGAFKAIIKDGWHLAKSRSMAGAFKGLAFSNNKLVGHADMLPISPEGNMVPIGPQAALGVFTVISMVTGQFFLSQINKKIGAIEDELSDIKRYLETQKRAEVIANDDIILNIYKNLSYILENESERQATSIELKLIKKESLSSALLFHSKIEAITFTKDSKEEDLNNGIKDLEGSLPQYWCAVRSYIIATVLETILMEMDDPDYLDKVRNDLIKKVQQYSADYRSAKERIIEFINTFPSLNRSCVIPEFIRKIGWMMPATDLVTGGIKASILLASAADSSAEIKSSEKKHEVMKKTKSVWKACDDLEPLTNEIEQIDIYKLTHNNPLDIICTNEAAYVKYYDRADCVRVRETACSS